MKKKFIMLSAAVLTMVSLAACSSSKSSDNDTDDDVENVSNEKKSGNQLEGCWQRIGGKESIRFDNNGEACVIKRKGKVKSIKYTLNGKKLTVIDGNDVDEMVITSLTDNAFSMVDKGGRESDAIKYTRISEEDFNNLLH